MAYKEIRSAHATAVLLIVNMYLYSDEVDKDVTRIRFTAGTLRAISNRSHLRRAFLDALEMELSSLGWGLLNPVHEIFALVKRSSVDNWTKISAKRLELLYSEFTSEHMTTQLVVDELSPNECLLDFQDDRVIEFGRKVIRSEEESEAEE